MNECHLRKSVFAAALFAVSVAGSMIAAPASAADTALNVYNWSDYIAKDTIPNFEKESGIKVKYDNYDSDDTLQAKMLAGSSGYDIVVPTSTYMAKQIQAGIYQKLDKSKLPNLSNLDPALMKLVAQADPGNQYGVPWAWGTDGIGYNVEAVKKVLGDGAPVDSWALIFDPANISKLKSCGVSLLDAASDVFPSVLQYLHKDPNSTNPADYMAALEVLKKIRPYITQFNSSGYINDLANNDICVALGYSGDVGIARRRASEAKRSYEIKFSNAKEGGLLWLDIMVIPKDAPHPEAALKWINYIEEPKVSAAITNEVFYPTANLASKQFVDPTTANDPNVFPPADVLAKLTVMKPVPSDILRLENRLWAELKTGR
ncbi:putrescine ABC transporter periplasmic binding protein [Pararobbsia alpina]|uniref:polyamine ABC transporter substrate-binding protein n=1 Tax=Pararobbsia alpina TaxID=621374 RepID=UPI0039A5AB64